MQETVAIIGASNKTDRYAYKALQELIANNHNPIPVNPKFDNIDGLKCYPDLESFPDKIDTITLYLRAANLLPIVPQIIKIKPKRVIFNPGTEDAEIMKQLEKVGIEAQEACTLVLLKTNQF
jgi:uncharacterized protein